ncbi:MAG: CoA transferase [Gammaproteobacteria bacterium]|nr:CoA transferase [Gammaproteobacteria bacterium]
MLEGFKVSRLHPRGRRPVPHPQAARRARCRGGSRSSRSAASWRACCRCTAKVAALISSQHNVGKKPMAMDLTTPALQAICRELIKQADVVVENFSPGAAEATRSGLGKSAQDQS